MTKKLQLQIKKTLYKLKKLIEKLTKHDIHPEDSEFWDPDYYYDLAEQLKEALKLLEGKKATNKYGQELILEEGLCSLIDIYQSQEEKNYD